MPQTFFSLYTVNGGQVTGGPLTDFPALVSLVDPRFKSVANGGHVANPSGSDLRPYTDASLVTPFTYELEFYDPLTGTVVMHVKVPSFDTGSVIAMACGDASLNTDGSNGPATFSNGYTHVYHHGNGTVLSLLDSLGTANGINHGVTAAAGKIDGCGSFVSGSSQYVDLGIQAGTVAMTYEAWIKGTSFPNDYNCILVRGESSVDYANLSVKSNGKILWQVAATTGGVFDGSGSNTLVPGTWYHLVLAYDNTNGYRMYVNGVSDLTGGVNGAANITSHPVNIGRQASTATRYFNGLIDEVRMSNVARTAGWITTQFNNQNNPGAFGTLGAEMPVGGSGSLVNCGSFRRLGDRNLFGGDRCIMDRAIGCNRRGDRGLR